MNAEAVIYDGYRFFYIGFMRDGWEGCAAASFVPRLSMGGNVQYSIDCSSVGVSVGRL